MSVVQEFIGPHQSLGQLLVYWPVFVCALVGGWGGTVLSRRIALLYDIVDRPDHLVKTHSQPIAYLGGVGIFLGFAVGLLVGMGILSFKSLQAEPFYQLIALVIGGALALVVGVTDDIHTLKPMQKIWGQVMAATILVLAGWWPDYDAGFASLEWQIPQGIITALEIVTVYAMVLLFCNALNLLDGIDSLCGGVSLIGTLGTLVLTLHIATWSQSLIEPSVLLITTLALAGAPGRVLGFEPASGQYLYGGRRELDSGFLDGCPGLEIFADLLAIWLGGHGDVRPATLRYCRGRGPA